MDYFDSYHFLRNKVNYEDDVIRIDEKITLHNFSFCSANDYILPGTKDYSCKVHDFVSLNQAEWHYDHSSFNPLLDSPDFQISENKDFRYHVFVPESPAPIREVVIYLNGFNEKYWTKHFPWAKKIAEDTGKTVVLFPMAFHMNRAPHEWSEPRLMHQISRERQERFPDIISSTLTNVAISTRLHAKPQRYFWSGLQAYYDVIQLVDQIKNGEHPLIPANASFDFFAYSIGNLLAQVLLMTNHRGYFNQSRLALFCGGAVFNRMSPVSRSILDSEANVALYSYVVEHIESHLKKDARLRHYLGEDHPEGYNLLSMINYKLMLEHREKIFRSLNDRILAIALVHDSVIPPYEVMNTLKGINRDIPIPVEVLDYPYPYSHEDPFPVNLKIREQVDQMFRKTFDRFCEFLD
jgi:hypothetical protein